MLNSTNDFHTENDSNNSGDDDDLYRSLWLSVILQALADAKNKSAKGKRKLDKLRALAWIAEANDPNSDFAQVCELAGVNCAKMKDRIDCILAEEKESIDFRCLKKTHHQKRSWKDRTRLLKKTKPALHKTVKEPLKTNGTIN